VSAAEVIAARIHREGSIPFDVFMECALYEPEQGFFARGQGAGRGGHDFVTSPEVGSLFGACVARAIDRNWDALGRPDPFLVVEPGAGRGRLARDIQRAAPECLAALRYVLVERSPSLRAHQREVLPIEPADEALGPFALRAAEEELVAVPAAGPVFASLEDLPEMPVDALVLANELLDNLPFGIAQWDGAGWDEVRVAVDGSRFVEILVPASESDASALTRVVDGRDLPPRTRLPIPRGVEAWLDECGQAMHTGVVVLVDYFIDVDELLTRGGDWLRTFRGHEQGSDPLDAPGSQDITSDVLRSHVERAAVAAGFSIVADRTQADWLRDLGLDELVADGRRAWDEGAARGDLVALAGRSRVAEGAALTDAAGLGAHRVVSLAKPPRTAPSEHR
jgi:SAM-dependent MidA family methyltransferase